MEIPLFNQSLVYAARIDNAVRRENLSTYAHKKQVNLVYKFDYGFYEREKKRFLRDACSYEHSDKQSGEITEAFLLSKLSILLVIKMLMKYLAHMIFRCLGSLQLLLKPISGVKVIRKSYVDDVEGLFDLEEDVVRFVYPFPLNLYRQWRYLRYLNKHKKRFVLMGLPYSLKDLITLFFIRNYRQLMRFESRAHMAHAIEKKKYEDLELVQCAEEYELGSYEYSRAAARVGFKVHNCAHGVGKYLPYQSYSQFDVITRAQKDYYEKFSNVVCTIREIKLKTQQTKEFPGMRVVAFLGQASPSAPALVLKDELMVLSLLNDLALIRPEVVFCYRKHPNSDNDLLDNAPNVRSLNGFMLAGDQDKIIQLSLYSTCFIDPNFIGKKALIETKYIKPAIAYGYSNTIVKLEDLKAYVEEWIDTD